MIIDLTKTHQLLQLTFVTFKKYIAFLESQLNELTRIKDVYFYEMNEINILYQKNKYNIMKIVILNDDLSIINKLYKEISKKIDLHKNKLNSAYTIYFDMMDKDKMLSESLEKGYVFEVAI
jgi:hypothetical protein